MSGIKENADVDVNVNGEKAEDQLTVLEQQAKKFRKEMERANKAGDIKGFKNAEKEFKAVNKQARQLARNTFDVEKVLKNLNRSTPKELSGALREMNKQINSGEIKRGSKQWKYYANQIRRVKNEQRRVNAELRATGPLMSRMAGKFNKYFAMMGTAAATVMGVVF